MLFRSASKQRAWGYELALFTAWHMAAFNSAAKVGKLKDFNYYRTKLTGGTTKAQAPRSWQERKAERQQQMDLLKLHLRQRQAPVRKKA